LEQAHIRCVSSPFQFPRTRLNAPRRRECSETSSEVLHPMGMQPSCTFLRIWAVIPEHLGRESERSDGVISDTERSDGERGCWG